MILLFLFTSWFSHAEVPQVHFTLAPATQENHVLQHVTMETKKLSDDLKVKILRLPQPLRQTLQSIQNKHGSVACDCGLFAQITAVLERPDRSDPDTLLFTGDTPAEWIACACDQDFAYMHLTNESHHLALQNTSYINKGQWLLPRGNARFLGLRRSGPSTEPMGQWIKRAEGNLLNEHAEKQRCQSELDPSSDEWMEIQYVEVIRNMGETKRWKITPIRQSDVPVEQRALLRSLLEGDAND